jgi:hypothetical protein
MAKYSLIKNISIEAFKLKCFILIAILYAWYRKATIGISRYIFGYRYLCYTFTILVKVSSLRFKKPHNITKRQPAILNKLKTLNGLDHDLNQEDIKDILHMEYPELNS